MTENISSDEERWASLVKLFNEQHVVVPTWLQEHKDIIKKLMKLKDLNFFITTIGNISKYKKITPEFIKKLLGDKEPEKLADFLGRYCKIDFIHDMVDETEYERGIDAKKELINSLDILQSTKDRFNNILDNERETLFLIFDRLSYYNILDLKVLDILINTPKKQLDLLLNRLSVKRLGILRTNIFLARKISKCSLPILAIDILFDNARLYHANIQNLQKSRDVRPEESSMKDDKVKQSNEKFQSLYEKFGKPLEQSEGLNNVELQIRKKILETIKESEQSGTEIHDFLTEENINAIASNTDAELLAQSRKLFTSNESLAQIAWRAYDPDSRTVDWPNLLTTPSSETAKETVFTTRESTAGMQEKGTTLESASSHVRKYAALCFLASQDKRISPETNQEICSEETRKEMWSDFISYVAEVRRAHNENTVGTDNPSCFPGTISRIAQSVNKHPEFPATEGITVAINNSIRAYIDLKLSKCLDQLESPEEKAKLYYSLIMLGLNNAEEVIANPSSILTILPNIDNIDSLTETEKQKIIQEHIKIRAEFLESLMLTSDLEHPDLRTYVFNYLEKHQINTSNKTEIEYLIGHALASIPLLGISVSAAQRKSMLQESEAEQENASSTAEPEENAESLFAWQTPDESAKNLLDIRIAIQAYWIPLFKSAEYEALITIIKDPDLCQKIIEERFAGFSLRNDPTLDKLLEHLRTRDNLAVLTELDSMGQLPKEFKKYLMSYSESITATLKKARYDGNPTVDDESRDLWGTLRELEEDFKKSADVNKEAKEHTQLLPIIKEDKPLNQELPIRMLKFNIKNINDKIRKLKSSSGVVFSKEIQESGLAPSPQKVREEIIALKKEKKKYQELLKSKNNQQQDDSSTLPPIEKPRLPR